MRVLILLSVVAVALAVQECGKNQHYSTCGTACPLTCDNKDNPPDTCVLMCVTGCHCDAGYVKTADGECVKPEECPAKAEEVCGENERFNECGTDCPLTCKNYRNPPKFCNLMCKIGCECEEGYIRSRDGRCVKPFNCPVDAEPVCGDNERYNVCGTSCPLTCENYLNPPKFCNFKCNIGCECEKGYVRSRDGRCLRPENCPVNSAPVCGDNQRYNECGTSCPLTCENYRNPPKFCNFMCNIGCECEKGYVKSRDGRCLRPENCPVDSAPVVKSCFGKPETGLCRAYVPSFSYDAQTGKCVKFIYGGCGGNGNRYDTEEKCMAHCGDIRPRQASATCELPVETGVCRGFFPRYYFDQATGQCQQFVYGGCGGNENNFETVEQCNKECGVQQAAEDVCGLEAETGNCRARIPRYHFDKKTGTCQKFTYGGCGGNENNFKTKEACQNACA